MSLQGPLLLVAENPSGDLVKALREAGAYPVAACNWADAPAEFQSFQPGAVILGDACPSEHEAAARTLCLEIATAAGPLVPLVERVEPGDGPALPIALAIDTHLPHQRLIATLGAALRVRGLHATVLRRIKASPHDSDGTALPIYDPLDDACVLVIGRGRFYPALTTAFGMRVGIMGAMSLDSASRQLKARDIDGIVIGDGLAPRLTQSFLAMLAQDPRYCEIPTAVMGQMPDDFSEALPNVMQFSGNPARLVDRMVPFVRMRAFDTRLRRTLKSLDADGMFDADTGLLTQDSFARGFSAAVTSSAENGNALSVARISFEGPYDRRISIDGARLVEKLIRNVDFACLDDDGSIVVALTQTDLRGSHLVARRIAGVLRQTLLAPYRERRRAAANVTLAVLKPGDSAETLLGRVTGPPAVAAE